MTALALQPPHATPFERALSLATDIIPRLEAAIAAIAGAKYRSPHASNLIPFLIAEYGLGEVSEFVPNQEQLLIEGVRWQRLRGTPKAIELGLAWLGYTAALEEAPTRRKRWHLFQLMLGKVRDNELPDLNRIEDIAGLSVGVRSHFFRGFAGYDVRALEYGWSKSGQAIVGNDSGARIKEGGALWSFGRGHELDTAPTQTQLTALGIWIAASTLPFTWTDMWFSWMLADFPWSSPINDVRRRIMAAALALKTCWIEFKNAAGQVIGYARARALHLVAASPTGTYLVGATKYEVAPASELLYIEALTDFGNGDGQISASHALIFDATPIDPAKPGLRWAAPGELQVVGGNIATHPRLGQKTETIMFGKTVRERVSTLLRMTAL
jgi:Phage tail protein (Tail_P2_I)